MVLSDHRPYDTDSSAGEEEDAWEIVGDETAPLAVTPGPAGADDARPSGRQTAAGSAGEEERQNHSLELHESDDGVERDENGSSESVVSSITGEHHSVSDVEESEDEEAEEEREEDARGDAQNQEEPASTMDPSGSNEKKGEQTSEALGPLVDTLLQMGFEKGHIEKAIGDLREEEEVEIDADAVIGKMMGETPPAQGGDVRGTWDFVESTVQDLDRRHQIRHRAQNCLENANRSARELWSNVREESQRFGGNFRESCGQADVQARAATAQAKIAVSSARDNVCRANEEHGIAEKVATAAVLGGAVLLALGNPRAGVGAMAVAGASLAAGEAMKQSSARSGSTYTRDYGLNEGVHLD
ncbi:hypothetical protein ACHAWF_003895 [Thalassiosira exigua]